MTGGAVGQTQGWWFPQTRRRLYDDWINWVLFESFDDHEVILEIHLNTSKMEVVYIVEFLDAS